MEEIKDEGVKPEDGSETSEEEKNDSDKKIR